MQATSLYKILFLLWPSCETNITLNSQPCSHQIFCQSISNPVRFCQVAKKVWCLLWMHCIWVSYSFYYSFLSHSNIQKLFYLSKGWRSMAFLLPNSYRGYNPYVWCGLQDQLAFYDWHNIFINFSIFYLCSIKFWFITSNFTYDDSQRRDGR